MSNPIAYSNGRTGEVVHATCWGDYVDSRRAYDAQGKPQAWGMIGTLYLPGAERKELKGRCCAHCEKAFVTP
jgi:hypothetical protein